MNPIKIFKNVLVVSLVLLIISGSVSAQEASIKITTHPRQIEKGDVFSVIISVESSGESIGTVIAGLSYDARIMEYDTGGGNAIMISDGKGGISDFNTGGAKTVVYELSFVAKATGTGRFSVDQSEIIGGETGISLGNPSAGINISVKNPVEETIEEAPKVDPEEDPVKITIGDEDYYILRDISGVALPEGFEKSGFKYKSHKVAAAENKTKDIIIMYIMNEKMESAFYLYDQDDGAFYPYVSLQTDHSHIILPIDIEVEGFEKMDFVELDASVEVLVSTDGTRDFYIVKAVASGGDIGYYLYDLQERTLQRVNVNGNEAVFTDEVKGLSVLMEDDRVRNAFFILASVCVLLGISWAVLRRKA
ncbi:hypothetical protein [Alkalibacter saccharofermentans]|uniref:Cohesin domain-containing protein n=1 Tax=Alkalibacter saccharofermentans DSM 14828 TaxID=1120975 RepID=A0A1M4VM86_9FIRM|nr:hypothetical protein [Alkalibacter saccharofermentans]SHE69910.1 hypothetical protein SAMN02746064_01039 [Alkalibacter saccharofermentans DSM 14828]